MSLTIHDIRKRVAEERMSASHNLAGMLGNDVMRPYYHGRFDVSSTLLHFIDAAIQSEKENDSGSTPVPNARQD